MIRTAFALAVLGALLIPAAGASAADTKAVVVVPPPEVVVEPAPVVVEAAPLFVAPSIFVNRPDPFAARPDSVLVAKPLKPEPRVAYGCKRVWRCDTQVCEWRRGCWGVYGYMEGPYYSQELAMTQWVHDGWPAPDGARPVRTRTHVTVQPSLK